jgi:hypothetical protein
VKGQVFIVGWRVNFYRLAKKIFATGIQQERGAEYKKKVFHVVEMVEIR